MSFICYECNTLYNFPIEWDCYLCHPQVFQQNCTDLGVLNLLMPPADSGIDMEDVKNDILEYFQERPGTRFIFKHNYLLTMEERTFFYDLLRNIQMDICPRGTNIDWDWIQEDELGEKIVVGIKIAPPCWDDSDDED